MCLNPVSTRRRFDVDTALLTSKQRCINVTTTSCAYWQTVNCVREFKKQTTLVIIKHKQPAQVTIMNLFMNSLSFAKVN